MKKLISGGTVALALLLAGCGGDEGGNTASNASTAAATPLPQIEAPNGDWTQSVTETADGGFLMGNPNAPVKLVEYASLTCPHCAEFAEEAGEPLRNRYVKSGQVSWEFRPFMLFPTDPGVSLLLRCQGPGPFFRLSDQLYATQREWSGRVQQLPAAEQQRIQSLPPQQQMVEMVKAAGLDQFFRQRGMPEARINQCLSDPQQLQKLSEYQSTAVTRDNVQGTPTFLINGEPVPPPPPGTSPWADLEPRLREAIG